MDDRTPIRRIWCTLNDGVVAAGSAKAFARRREPECVRPWKRWIPEVGSSVTAAVSATISSDIASDIVRAIASAIASATASDGASDIAVGTGETTSLPTSCLSRLLLCIRLSRN